MSPRNARINSGGRSSSCQMFLSRNEEGKMKKKNIILETKGLKLYFATEKKDKHRKSLSVKAVDGVDMQIYEGETLGLVGESGCGKSTIGRTVLKLYKPTEGIIKYKDKDITKWSVKKMMPLRKEMQLIFQDPYSSLNPRMTVGQIIGEALVAHGMYKKEIRRT